MKDMLALLAEEKKPELSPYFEARLRRALRDGQQPRPRYARAVRIGSLVLMALSVAMFWRLPHLQWLIPMVVWFYLPEDWGDAIARRFVKSDSRLRYP
jgi:hypothetical protein